MFRRIALFILAAVPVILQSCMVISPQHKATATRQQSVDHVPGSPLVVNSRNGAVEIVGDPSAKSVEITATISAAGRSDQEAKDRLAQAALSIVRSADQTLTVSMQFPDSGDRSVGNADGASFVIRLPDARGVTIGTSNGSVAVKNVAGALDVDTSNGGIIVSGHNGPAVLETSNGPIEVSNLHGSLLADTSNGSVTAENVQGPVTIDTSNGSVALVLAEGEGGPLRVDTSNGNIDIVVGSGFDGRVAFDTSNGALKILDPAGRIRAQNVDRNDGTIEVGDSSAAGVAVEEPSVIDTSNGDITFTVSG